MSSNKEKDDPMKNFSEEKPESSKNDSECSSFNDWEGADLGDDQRKQKFLRLMGANKKRSSLEKKPPKVFQKSDKFKAAHSSNLASAIESEFNTAFKQNVEKKAPWKRHTGLGFQHEEDDEQATTAEGRKDGKHDDDIKVKKEESQEEIESAPISTTNDDNSDTQKSEPSSKSIGWGNWCKAGEKPSQSQKTSAWKASEKYVMPPATLPPPPVEKMNNSNLSPQEQQQTSSTQELDYTKGGLGGGFNDTTFKPSSAWKPPDSTDASTSSESAVESVFKEPSSMYDNDLYKKHEFPDGMNPDWGVWESNSKRKKFEQENGGPFELPERRPSVINRGGSSFYNRGRGRGGSGTGFYGNRGSYGSDDHYNRRNNYGDRSGRGSRDGGDGRNRFDDDNDNRSRHDRRDNYNRDRRDNDNYRQQRDNDTHRYRDDNKRYHERLHIERGRSDSRSYYSSRDNREDDRRRSSHGDDMSDHRQHTRYGDGPPTNQDGTHGGKMYSSEQQLYKNREKNFQDNNKSFDNTGNNVSSSSYQQSSYSDNRNNSRKRKTFENNDNSYRQSYKQNRQQSSYNVNINVSLNYNDSSSSRDATSSHSLPNKHYRFES